MTYQTDEQSVAASRPRELYTFELSNGTVYYLTTFNRDVVAQKWNDALTNVTYLATPGLSRSSLPVVSVGGTAEVAIDIPYEHALAQRLLPGVRRVPRYCLCTILRQQAVSGGLVRYWQGYVTSVNVRDRLCGMRVPDSMDDALDAELPSAAVSTTCNNVLFDTNCRLNRLSYGVGTVRVAGGTGTPLILLSTIGFPLGPNYFVGGELVHTLTSERRTVISQVSTTVLLDAPFNDDEFNLDSNLVLYPGCDHTIATCVGTFNNRRHFVGMPQLPVSNPWFVGMPAAVVRT